LNIQMKPQNFFSKNQVMKNNSNLTTYLQDKLKKSRRKNKKLQEDSLVVK
jgi:hypothetical protein